MRFEGTDVRGFDIGVFVPDARPSHPDQPGAGKTDTNWYWISYVRMCNTCIWEKRKGIDCGIWQVNVDASIKNSVAIRTAASYGRWFVIMGTWAGKCSVIFDPGATHNVMEVTPPLQAGLAPAEDNSGNKSNLILCSSTPSAAEPRAQLGMVIDAHAHVLTGAALSTVRAQKASYYYSSVPISYHDNANNHRRSRCLARRVLRHPFRPHGRSRLRPETGIQGGPRLCHRARHRHYAGPVARRLRLPGLRTPGTARRACPRHHH